MRPENDLGPAERELEEALRRLTLPAATIDRDRLMFQAGRHSMGRHLLAWRAMTVLLAAGAGLSWAIRPAPQSVERVIYVGNPAPQPLVIASSTDLSEANYLRLQRRVLAEGLDALPDARVRASREAPKTLSLDDLLDELSRGT